VSQPDRRVRITREAVVRHDARLDILCCLDSDEPLATKQISGRTGMEPPRTAYHLKVLRAFGLIGTTQEDGRCPVLYVLRLEQQPEWVTDAVNEHREVAR
jgi:DNA-binding transcriptional ArsR family regulator